MKTTLYRRLAKVEQAIAPKQQEGVRLICSSPCSSSWKKLDLAQSTCTRYRCEDGALTEIVHLDGDRAEISEEELERFIQSFPIRNQHGA
jgi:hypothetical protein